MLRLSIQLLRLLRLLLLLLLLLLRLLLHLTLLLLLLLLRRLIHLTLLFLLRLLPHLLLRPSTCAGGTTATPKTLQPTTRLHRFLAEEVPLSVAVPGVERGAWTWGRAPRCGEGHQSFQRHGPAWTMLCSVQARSQSSLQHGGLDRLPTNPEHECGGHECAGSHA